MYLYQADGKLPGTRILLDVRALRERLRKWIGTDDAADLSIVNIRYKPATSCLVSYQLHTEQGISHFHAKAFDVDDWQVRKVKLDKKVGNVWSDDEFAFAAFRFPDDSVLPALKTLAVDSQKFLSRVLFDSSLAERLMSFETLSYKPNRRFAGRLKFEIGEYLVLKLYTAAKFQNALNAAAALKKSLAVETPARVGRSNRHHALAYDWIAGEELEVSALRTDEIEPLMVQIIEYLDRLHVPVVPSTTALPCQSAGGGLDAIANDLAGIYPPLAPLAKSISCEIMANLTELYRTTLIHGDFHEHQVIVSTSGVRACDFDNFCVGDPTADLANFLAHLAYRAGTHEIAFEKVARMNELSFRHYLDEHDQHSLNRLLWNRLASIFRLVTHPFRSGSSQWMQETEQLLHSLAEQMESTIHATRSTTLHVESCPPEIKRGSGWQWGVEPKHADNIGESIQSDETLNFLKGALDPACAEEFLQRHCPDLHTVFGSYTVNRIIPRRHRPGRRCILEFQLSTSQGARTVLGKVSAKRLDRRTCETQQSLFENHDFDYESPDGISVPRALGCCPRWKMWVQDKVVATTGSHLLDKSQLSRFTHRIAAAISKLHQSDLCPQQEHTVANELEILEERLSQVMEQLSVAAPKIERILQNCVEIGQRVDESVKAAVHRDFYQDQIMFNDERTYLVDLDLVKIGHPALDVGNFLAHLTEHGIRQHGTPQKWQREELEIRAHYLAVNPRCQRDEIDAFKAISFARHIFISWSRPGRRKWTSQIIEVADQLTRQMVPKTVTP